MYILHYRRLDITEREEISRWLAVGKDIRYISNLLGRAPSTISREVTRSGRGRYGYRAILSQRRSQRSATKRRGGKRILNAN